MASRRALRAHIALALALLACLHGQAQDIRRDSPWSAYDIPPVTPIPNWYEVRGGSWHVPPGMLQEIASRLKPWLGGNVHYLPDADYVIQFRGEQRDGRRLVRLSGSCRGYARSGASLSERFAEVSDGGKCYFDADYDPSDGQISFRYHGYG